MTGSDGWDEDTRSRSQVFRIPCLAVTEPPGDWRGVAQALRGAGFQVAAAEISLDSSDLAIDPRGEVYLLQGKTLSWIRTEINHLRDENLRLQRYTQAREQYIRLVTHELKSPIAAVENYLRMILQGYIRLADQGKVLERCVSRTCQERQLIDDLLDLSRLEGELIVKEMVRMDLTLNQVLQDYQDEMEEKEFQVTLKIDRGIPPINAAPGLLKSIWCNLISNACKYTPESGRIIVGLQVEGSQLVGWVEDSGIGISEKDQERLFQEFFRSENARKLDIPGTGLGLVIVKKIVSRMGGHISVTSRKNQGSRFQFSIPLDTG